MQVSFSYLKVKLDQVSVISKFFLIDMEFYMKKITLACINLHDLIQSLFEL
jgi:hypothetical protein